MFRPREWLAWAAILGGAAAVAQEPQPYDGLRAGEDAHQLAEEQRRLRVDDQLYLNDAMRFRAGWLPGDVVWYGYAGGGAVYDLDYAHAQPPARPLGRGRRFAPLRYRWPLVTVFEPWPYVPGDVYGYHFAPRIRQPIGQRQVQTGPHRWESHPVYPEELSPAPEALPAATEPPRRDEPPPERPRRRTL